MKLSCLYFFPLNIMFKKHISNPLSYVMWKLWHSKQVERNWKYTKMKQNNKLQYHVYWIVTLEPKCMILLIQCISTILRNIGSIRFMLFMQRAYVRLSHMKLYYWILYKKYFFQMIQTGIKFIGSKHSKIIFNKSFQPSSY